MLRFRPDIKPPMWGPPDAVRFAVRANCERMGMPEPLCFTPCWSVSFGEALVGSTAFYNEGIHAVGTTGAHYFKLPVPQTNLVELYSIYSGELKWSVQLFLSTLSSANVLRLARLGVGIYRLYGNDAYLSYVNSFVADPVDKSQATWSAGWSQRLRRQRVSITDNTFRSSSVAVGSSPITEVPIGVDEHFRFAWDSKHKFFAFWNVFPSNEVDARLHYEPYTLLMPVARPLYFDLGASAGTDNLTAADLVTSAPVLGTPALGQVHGLAATALTVSAPVLGTPAVGQIHSLVASALVVGSPVLDTPSLSENAPDVDALTANDLVVGSPALGAPSLDQIHVLGSDGIVTGPPVLGSPTITQVHALAALGLTVGVPVLGTPALNGSDIVLISPDDVGRATTLQARNYRATLAARNYAARL